MRIIARKTLTDYGTRYPETKSALEAWYAEANVAKWETPTEVKAKYGSASILKGDRVVFNICGNKYRLVVQIHYKIRVIYIRFIGTHNEYNKIDAGKI